MKCQHAGCKYRNKNPRAMRMHETMAHKYNKACKYKVDPEILEAVFSSPEINVESTLVPKSSTDSIIEIDKLIQMKVNQLAAEKLVIERKMEALLKYLES